MTVGPGDVMLSFGAFPAELPARVRFLHPLHNFALISYDPSQLAEEVGGRRAAGPGRAAAMPAAAPCKYGALVPVPPAICG